MPNQSPIISPKRINARFYQQKLVGFVTLFGDTVA
jgi:hypothetical protein